MRVGISNSIKFINYEQRACLGKYGQKSRAGEVAGPRQTLKCRAFLPREPSANSRYSPASPPRLDLFVAVQLKVATKVSKELAYD